jgi:excinuclease UvrABC helicase subunit UvrB
MSQAGILFEEEEPSADITDDSADDDLYSDFKSLNISELEDELQKAVDAEDYEKASLIRDEIRKRK